MSLDCIACLIEQTKTETWKMELSQVWIALALGLWSGKVETHARGMTGGELEGLVDYRPDGWTTLSARPS